MQGEIKQIGKQWHNEKGATLILVLLISLILILVAVKFMSGNDQEIAKTTDNVLHKQAEDAIEAGIEYARDRLKAYDEWNINGWGEVIKRETLGGAFGYITVTFSGYSQENKTAQLTIDSNFKGRKAHRDVNIKAIQAKTPYPAAICAIENLSITGNSSVDSFSSATGPYSLDFVTNSGHIGSNGRINISGNSNIKGRIIAANDLYFTGNANVSNNVSGGGNVYLKDKANVQGSLFSLGNLAGEMENKILGDAILGGATQAMQGNIGGVTKENAPVFVSPPCDGGTYDMADLAVKAAAANNNRNCPQIVDNKLTLVQQESVTLTGGAYYLTELTLAGNSRLFIDGEVVIVLDGDGPFNLGGNAFVNATREIKDLTIYSNSGAAIKMSGNNCFAGNIYAPKAALRRIGNSEFFGSVLAKEVFIGGASTFHYDTKLSSVGGTNIVLPGVIEMEVVQAAGE